jgi:hypothetical protein
MIDTAGADGKVWKWDVTAGKGKWANDSVGSSGGYYTKAQVDSAISANVNTLIARVTALEAKLQYVTCDASAKNIYVTGANLNIRSGAGTSDATANGLGNLIVGYNEGTGSKTGSHNVVIGPNHTYTSTGGFVAGYGNTISGASPSVLGGYQNTAKSDVGGNGNIAVVVGGQGNIADGLYSTVCGGSYNTASGVNSTVSGGDGNTATGGQSTVSGGESNSASGDRAVVSGGETNNASGMSATVSGGKSRTAINSYNWTAGTYNQAQ